MEFLRPTDLEQALELKSRYPTAVPIAGGTDVMVELNFDRRRPDQLLDVTRVDELARWSQAGDGIRLGAAVPYAKLIREVGGRLPGLAMASRTVGSPQIRNRATVGGNIASSSPAGDTHPVLLACGARIEVASTRGTRTVEARDFYTGVKRNVLEPDELITAILLPAARGPQQFSKIGTRNAMVIAVCSFGLSIDVANHTVGAAIGSASPTPRRTGDAEAFAAAELPWDRPVPLPESLTRRFGELAASAAAPIDDVRGTADYRKHAISVMARRTLRWAWQEHRANTNGKEGDAACA